MAEKIIVGGMDGSQTSHLRQGPGVGTMNVEAGGIQSELQNGLNML